MKNTLLKFSSLLASLLGLSMSAAAYVGPGAGLSAIGTFLAIFFAVLVAILGFFWYPIKRIICRLRGEALDCEDEDEGDDYDNGDAR